MSDLVVCTKDELRDLIKAAVTEALSSRVEVEYLTRKQVAELLGCSERSVLTRVKDGLPGEKLGNEWRFERAKVVEFMRRTEEEALRADHDCLDHIAAGLRALPPPNRPGVYAVEGSGGFIKIGKSKSIRKRLLELQGSHPIRLRLVAILSSDPSEESAFHAQMSHLREEGEWFRPEEPLLRVIRRARGLDS